MSLKYRIVYDSYSRYEKNSNTKRITRYLFPFLLCIIFILFLAASSDTSKLYELILPGDPAITTSAFRQLSDAMDRGEPLSEALDVFCDTIMDVR